MNRVLEAELSQPLRLALAWAPVGARSATLAMFALDTRLSGFLQRGSEPLPVQMRMAWWRETLSAAPAGWPGGDPLLDELRRWRAPAALVPLVDGWEGLLAERLQGMEIEGFASGRAEAWAALASELGVQTEVGLAARTWALADLAANLSLREERQSVIGLAEGMDFAVPHDRALRPLAVLAGLGRRALRRGGAPLLEGRGAALAALRVGMFGR